MTIDIARPRSHETVANGEPPLYRRRLIAVVMTSPATSSICFTESELDAKCLGITNSLSDAIAAFHADTELRLLPIVDELHRPVGAIFEKDIRRLLLNPYGHALLRNPSYSHNLSEHVRFCPTMELSSAVSALIDHYRRCDGREGMILTKDGRLHATLTNRRLLLLSIEHEHRAAQARLDHADKIGRAGNQLEERAGALSEELVGLANSVQRLAEATVERAALAGGQATSAAAATVQTRDSLMHLATRGQSLAGAFSKIEQTVANNRRIAAATAARVEDAREHAKDLLEAAHVIDNVMAMVGEVAGTVNLLSLNATIEAARAGDAGRGFAVVAGEIRKLSDQTQEATQTIGGRVHALQVGIERVAAEYAEVVEAIETMAAGAAAIDDAVSHEAGTTRLIASSVADACEASITIERAVTTIVGSVRSASVSAHELDGMATAVRVGASSLRESVGTFLIDVAA